MNERERENLLNSKLDFHYLLTAAVHSARQSCVRSVMDLRALTQTFTLCPVMAL